MYDETGKWVTSTISLDTILGNDDGSFRIGRESFSTTVQGIHLRGSVLWANLRKNDGTWTSGSWIDLDSYLTNNDGRLELDKV